MIDSRTFKFNISKFVKDANDMGIFPSIELNESANVRSREKEPYAGGMVPVIPGFRSTCSSFKYFK